MSNERLRDEKILQIYKGYLSEYRAQHKKALETMSRSFDVEQIKKNIKACTGLIKDLEEKLQ